MSPAEREVASLYVEALRNHLSGAGEEALHKAYEVGRLAVTLQVGVVELVMVHHNALSQVLTGPDAAGVGLIGPAADFLAECLSPFEMMLRGYSESNARLTAANTDLTKAHVALEAAHAALKAEVAERERAEAALVHAQKLQAVGLLAGGVAHHFNNLLTVVLGNLQLARRRLEAGEDIDRFLTAATSGAQRGADVVKQLLTFSRQQVLTTRVLDLAAWAPQLRTLLGGVLRGDIAVEVDVPPVWAVRTDPAQLELAVLNLAVNARDAMPEGGTLRISAANLNLDDERLGLHGEFVVLSVADTGMGIEPQVAERVFEPFFTTKALGPGAGLGLSQVHGFAHQAGGAVDLESIVGEGTTIRLYLPAVRELADAKVPDDSRSEDLQVEASGRVLVVDDDEEVADLTGALLEGGGFAVTLAHRARAALDLLDAGEPVDLVLSDVVMPGMNGVQLAEEVRRRFPELPVLLTTGYSDELPSAAAQGLPILAKPFDADVLCARVADLLRSGTT
jgi:two-component system, NtrC family, sensor kinase